MPRDSKIDPELLETFCIQQMKAKDVAEYFGVNRTTLNAYCKKHYNASFSSFSQQKALKGKAVLVNKALKLAEKNGAVMIFLLKNWCGMKDNPEAQEKDEGFTKDMQAWFKKVKGEDCDNTD